jgi:quinol monooxygenase YgiN
MATDDKCCTIVPYFKVHTGKMQEFRSLCEQFVAKTKTEQGCLYYGWSFSGDEAFCREGYIDAESTLAHVQNVGALLGEITKISDMTRLEVHGPAAELEKLRGPFADLKPHYFTLEYGFRR